LAKALGWRSVVEMRRTMSNEEYLHWMAYFDQEAHLRDAASRHPKWSPEKCWQYVKQAFGLHLQAKGGK
jgi:hypothetical protein